MIFTGRKDAREWNGSELATFEPMNSRRIDRNGFFSTDIGAIFEVGMLPLLLGFQVQTCTTLRELESGRVL